MKVITIFTITLLLCVSMAVQSYAQPDVMPEIEKVLEEGRRNITLPDFLNLLGLDGEMYKTTRKIQGVEHFIFRRKSPYNKVSFQTNWFDFSFLTDAQHKILFSSVELLGVKTDEKRIFQQVHTDFQIFLEAHETFYEVKIDIDNEIMSPFKDFTLAIDNYINNSHYETLLNLVKQKDTETLERWLKSMNPTIQTYAVIGFEILKKQDANIKITKKQQKLITHVKQLEDKIPFHSSIDYNEEISIKEALSDSYLETFWYIIKDAKIMRS